MSAGSVASVEMYVPCLCKGILEINYVQSIFLFMFLWFNLVMCLSLFFLSALICKCWFIGLVSIWHTVTANKFWKIENSIQLKFDTVLTIVFFLYALVFRFVCRTWFTFSHNVKIKVKTFDRKGWKETGNLEKYHTR